MSPIPVARHAPLRPVRWMALDGASPPDASVVRLMLSSSTGESSRDTLDALFGDWAGGGGGGYGGAVASFAQTSTALMLVLGYWLSA